MKNKIYVPPIKIQGKKTKLVSWILRNVKFSDNGRWVEPFMGSGVVGFNYDPAKALFCDSNPHIIEFYNSIKKGLITSEKIYIFLKKEGEMLSIKGQEHFYFIRDRFNSNHNPLDFLFLNRSCFNGMIRFNRKYKFNVPFGHKPERFRQAYITKIVNQVKYIEELIHNRDWVFKCQDFRETLQDLDINDFVYCDPPYIGRHVDYYDSWSEDDEIDLHRLLVNSNAKFLLSTWHNNKYRKNEYLKKIWWDCNTTTKKHFYHIGGKEINRNEMIEALVSNLELYDEAANLINNETEDICLFS